MSLLAVGLPSVPDSKHIGWRRTFDARTTILGLKRQRTISAASSIASSLAAVSKHPSLVNLSLPRERGRLLGNNGCAFSKQEDIIEEDYEATVHRSRVLNVDEGDNDISSVTCPPPPLWSSGSDTVLEIHPYYIEQDYSDTEQPLMCGLSSHDTSSCGRSPRQSTIGTPSPRRSPRHSMIEAPYSVRPSRLDTPPGQGIDKCAHIWYSNERSPRVGSISPRDSHLISCPTNEEESLIQITTV